MRPNVDIGNQLHAQVKEMAEEMGYSLSEMYEEVIYTGINSAIGDQGANIQVGFDTYTALDRLRDEEESFDDIIRRVVDNGTATTVDSFSGKPPDIESGPVEPIPDDAEPGAACVHFDPVDREECGDDAEYRQKYRFVDGGSWEWYYYCPEHVPDETGE